MIERIARRAGGFAATTALRWVGAGRDAAAEVVPSVPSREKNGSGKALVTVAAGAVALISSNKAVRTGVERGLRAVSRTVRPDPAPASRNGNRNGNGSKDLSAKTRAELYELAKKADLPGRSSMSKDELTKALSR